MVQFFPSGGIPEGGASACNDHRPFDGVPLVGINLDGSSLRDGFSANIPGNLGDSVLGDDEVVGGTAETQHAVPGTGDAVDVPLAVFGNLDLGIVGLFRNNGPGFGGHGMDAAGGEIQRLGRTVRLDNFSECGVASGANIIAGIRTGLAGIAFLGRWNAAGAGGLGGTRSSAWRPVPNTWTCANRLP